MAENTILGIDLRVTSVKVIEIKKGSKGFILVNWGMDEVPFDLIDKHPDKEAAQAKIIQRILAVNRIKARDAVLVVGGADVLVRQMSLPPLSRADSREAIKWKMKDEIAYPLEEAIVDFIPLAAIKGAAKTEIDFLAAAAHKDTIVRAMEIGKLAGIHISSIVPVPFAVKEVFGKEIAKGITCLVYMGRRTTNISFFRDGVLQLNREVPIGGEDITRAMTSVLVSEEGRLELKYDEAEKIKREYGIPVDLASYPKLGDIPISHLQAVVRPALEKIEDELLRTIEYYRSIAGDVKIEKVVLTGGSSRTPHLLEFLTAGLGISFTTVDPLADLIIDTHIREKGSLTLAAPQMAVALGAALNFYVPRNINLLPEEIREKWKLFFRRHANPLELSVLFVILMLLCYAAVFAQGYFIRSQIEATKKNIEELKPKLTRLEELEKAVREEEGRMGIFKSIELNRVQLDTVMEDLSLNLPPSVMLTSINFIESSKSANLSGVVFARGDTAENILSRFVLDLSRAPSFQKIELKQANRVEGYLMEAFTFEIAALVKRK
jgi:type IV pilus assembly protein PilM